MLIGLISVKEIWKNVPILQVGGPAPAPLTPPVIRVVLLHTEPAVQDLCPDTVDVDIWKHYNCINPIMVYISTF